MFARDMVGPISKMLDRLGAVHDRRAIEVRRTLCAALDAARSDHPNEAYELVDGLYGVCLTDESLEGILAPIIVLFSTHRFAECCAA